MKVLNRRQVSQVDAMQQKNQRAWTQAIALLTDLLGNSLSALLLTSHKISPLLKTKFALKYRWSFLIVSGCPKLQADHGTPMTKKTV